MDQLYIINWIEINRELHIVGKTFVPFYRYMIIMNLNSEFNEHFLFLA